MKNRREFLKGVSASSILFLANPSWANFVEDSKTDVIIIGAGLSGLYSAMQLEERGLSVRILEGNTRIGGRMYTLDELAGRPNTGGTEVGDGYKRVVSLCNKLGIGLLESASDRTAQLYVINGKLIKDSEWASSEFNKLNENEKKYLPHLLETILMQGKNILETLNDWYNPKFANWDIPFGEFLHRNGASQEAIRLINANANTNDIFTTSTLNIMKSMTFRIKGGSRKTLRIEGGSQRLPEAIAKSLKAKVETNKKVAQIQDKGNSIIVKCTDRSTFEAKKVIVSTPFPALKNIKIKGNLSPTLREAILNLPYTKITQVHFNIKSEFWKEDGLAANMWTDGAIGRFFTDKASNGVTNALCWINGLEAIEADKMSESAFAKMVLAELKNLRPASEGKIEVAKINSWGNNPFAGGAYYHLAPKQASKFYPEILKPAGNIYFCGEHTALENNGMEAAAESAERVVNQIISAS